MNMNTRLFRNGSVRVWISLVPYKFVLIYLYVCYGYILNTYLFICTIVKNAFYSNSLEFLMKTCSVCVFSEH